MHRMRILIPLILLGIVLSACADSPLHPPLKNASVRATPLSFGVYVTPDPAQNPIEPPERFSGYHAATDYEVSEGELGGDVPVYAICSGKVRFSGVVDGYGGLLLQACKIGGRHVTVLYGHLDLTGLATEDTRLRAGDTIGLLADAKSFESGYTRKHLHLGIRKGKQLDFRGYVQTEEELSDYINPENVLPPAIVDLPIESAGEVPYWEEDEE